jgi:energy-coupling factor transporter ATP-binding protein EcfA2
MWSADARPARAAAAALPGLRVPGLQPAGAHLGAGERRAAAAVPRRQRQRAPRRRGARAAAVGLGGWEHHTPAELSGGQQQRVAIARAIVTEPTVVLADEPTGNLDTQRSHEIMGLLLALNRDHGITVLMVTHEPDMAAYARRMVHFVDGRIAKRRGQPQPAGRRRPAADRACRGEPLMLYSVFMLALRSVRRNLLRSFLTILGIVIGVSAVITMVTLGNGATQAIRRRRSPAWAANLLMVMPGQRQGGPAAAAVACPSSPRPTPRPSPAQIGGVAAVAPQGAPASPWWPTAATGPPASPAAPTTGSRPATGSWPAAALRRRRTAGRRGGVHHRRNRAREIFGGTAGQPAWASSCASSSSRAR